MERLQTWLARRGFRLLQERGARDEVELLSRTVTLDSAVPYQKKLAALIHECGHVRIFLSRLRKPRTRVCGASLREDLLAKGRCDRRGRSARLSLLQEEMEAWESGERLARSLGVRYTRRVLEKNRTWALMTYVTHAAARMRSSSTFRFKTPSRKVKRNS